MDLKIGDKFSTTKQITDTVVRAFAELSGDYNPIHLDEEFAAKTQFKKRIAHGNDFRRVDFRCSRIRIQRTPGRLSLANDAFRRAGFY